MGSDLFTTKCEAHNYVVPYRSSCPICVSAKRSQLHAANLAHMPRYLFEQKLNTACDETGLHKPWQAKPVPVPLVPPSTPKYQLNFTSTYGAASLSNTTLALLRKLDKYEGTLGQLRMDHQKIIASRDKQSTYYQLAVKSMAVNLWNQVSAGEDREMSMKVRDQFLAQVEYLYNLGQRLEVVKPLPAVKAGLHDLVDCLYDYLVTSSKELYHDQVLLEKDLDSYPVQDNHNRKDLINHYRSFAYRVGDAYMKAKMYDCHRVDITTIFKLQERLADGYLAGDRR